jgi:hypothetical protein
MPILDINGHPITHLNSQSNIRNIEFGAGKNYFGKVLYPECFLTDKNLPPLSHFTELPYYDKDSNCHYIDFICDFDNHNFNEHTFDTIILCNPFGFGYSTLILAQSFFNRLGDLLNDNGQVVVISSHTNIFGKQKNLQRFLDSTDPEFYSKYIFELESFEELTPEHVIRLDFTFRKSCLDEIATPSQKMIIRKIGIRNDG